MVSLRTDEIPVRRTLQNLIRNAIRHTPTGTKVVVRIADEPEKVRRSVIDDGLGLPSRKVMATDVRG